MATVRAKGIAALSGAKLTELTDRVVTALRVREPLWFRMYAGNVSARVTEILLDGARHARLSATVDHDGNYSTGGIKVTYDKTAEGYEVWVLVASVYDEALGIDGEEPAEGLGGPPWR